MIKGWTDAVRWPRLGTFGLGVKTEKGAPRSVDYFVVPPEVAEVYGEKPRELDVIIPFEDDVETLEVVFPAWLKRYGAEFGLICRGDNETAELSALYARRSGAEYGVFWKNGRFYDAAGRPVPLTSGEDGRGWLRIPCSKRTCPHYLNLKCREVAILNVLLPKVPGILGVYSIDTGSFSSYQNIKNALALLKGLAGRISFIPLKLKVRVQEAHPVVGAPGEERQIKSLVPVMYLDMGDLTFERVLEMGRRGTLVASLSLPAPKGAPEAEEEAAGFAPEAPAESDLPAEECGEGESPEAPEEAPSGGPEPSEVSPDPEEAAPEAPAKEPVKPPAPKPSAQPGLFGPEKPEDAENEGVADSPLVGREVQFAALVPGRRVLAKKKDGSGKVWAAKVRARCAEDGAAYDVWVNDPEDVEKVEGLVKDEVFRITVTSLPSPTAVVGKGVTLHDPFGEEEAV